MVTSRRELTRQAARLFAEKGYHGTSADALADRFAATLVDGIRGYSTR